MSGSGPGQFNSPRGVWPDARGRVFVADRQNHRIQYFTSSGSFLDMWCSYGSGNGQFNLPCDVEIAPNGFAYVADGRNSRIQYFREDNPATWGNPGRNDPCPCGSGKKFKHCHGAY